VEIPTPEVAHSGAFLLWGHNPSSTSLILAHDIVAARKRGMKIVAVDPRRVGIAAQADVLLQVRPGTDGALALAMIDVVIQERLYDEAFVRQWTNGWLLLRDDTGLALTEGDLTGAGSPERFVAWDAISDAPVIYDSASGAFEHASIRPALFGKRLVRLPRWTENFMPAGIRRIGNARASASRGNIGGGHRRASGESQGSGALACGQSPGEHVHAQRCRATHQRNANEPGDRNALCVAGRH